MKILLISGHGSGDPGATSNIGGTNYREDTETRRVTAALKPLLRDYCEVTIYPTDRNAYDDYKNGTLAAVAQFSRQDYVLEVHFNAFSAAASDGKTKGVECYVPTTETNTGAEQTICNYISAKGFTNRGVKKYNWAVISRAKQAGVSSALLEVCFIDDPDDMALYNRKFNEIVKAIAEAIIDCFDLKREDPPVSYEQFKAYVAQYEAEKAIKRPSDWSEDAREWAEANGIMKGDDTGAMRYKSPVTREELAQVLYNAIGTV